MINNPSEDPTNESSRIARAIWAAMQTQTANNAKNFITKMAKEETAKALDTGADIADFAVGVQTPYSAYLSVQWRLLFNSEPQGNMLDGHFHGKFTFCLVQKVNFPWNCPGIFLLYDIE